MLLLLLLGDGLLALLVKHLEINLGQVHRRESGAGNHVGNIGTQIRIDNVRATNAKQWIELLGWNIARFKNTGSKIPSD